MRMMTVLLFSGVLLLGVFVNAENCREGERTVLKGTACTAFEECIDEEIYVKQCIPGYIFDSVSLKCKHMSEANCTDLSTTCDETKLYPRPDTCRIYEKCEKGRIVPKFCPIGQIFDPKINSCKRGLKCENCVEGHIIAGTSCVTYNLCQNGKWRVRYCDPFFKFNPEINKCVWYTQYNCTSEQINECKNGDIEVIKCHEYKKCIDNKWITHSCALGEFYDEESMMCKVGSCNKISKRDVQKCVNGHKRRVEGECRKYTECINNEEVVKSCPECLNFDDDTRECRFVTKKPCPSPAPPVPTDPTTPLTTTTTTAAPDTTEPPVTTAEPTSTAFETTTHFTETPATTPEPTSSVPVTTDTSVSPKPLATTSKTKNLKPLEPNSAPKGKHIQPDLQANCKEGEKTVILGDCKLYAECHNGIFIQKSCGWFSHFDSVTKECAYFSYTCAQ